jgi:hypothetical protein
VNDPDFIRRVPRKSEGEVPQFRVLVSNFRPRLIKLVAQALLVVGSDCYADLGVERLEPILEDWSVHEVMISISGLAHRPDLMGCS